MEWKVTEWDDGRKDETNLTLTNMYGTYSITVPGGDQNLPSMIENLLKPVLKSAGFSEKQVNEHLGDWR